MSDINMNPNTTTGLSAEMKTYYSDYLIDNAVPNLVHDQFGQKHPIPANGGKTINFRKFVPFSKASKPLTEGVTPAGGSLSVTDVTAEVAQYGYYVTLSDMLVLTAVDNTLVETTKLLGSQAGSTLDTVTREVLNSGTSVMYAGGVEAREALDENCKLTVDDIFRAARMLKSQNAPKIDGGYVAIIHPDVAYDLMRDSEWIDVNKYANAETIYEGEIGKLGGVRFVESTEAKVFTAPYLYGTKREMQSGGFNTEGMLSNCDVGKASICGSMLMNQLTQEEASELVGKTVYIVNPNKTEGQVLSVAVTICGISLENSYIFYENTGIPQTFPFDISTGFTISSGGAGFNGRSVYSTLVMGANAYGVTEVTGGGLEHIVKQMGSGGTADPLNQRSTAGWKGTKAAELLVDNYLVRIESASTFNGDLN